MKYHGGVGAPDSALIKLASFIVFGSLYILSYILYGMWRK